MMIQAILSNPSHPEYGVATIPFPIPRDQYAHCMELLAALEIGDAVKADCKVEKIDSFYTVLKRTEMRTVNEAADDFEIWEADCTMKYCLKEPEELYDFITGTLKPVPVSSGESTSQQE